jgi:prepilin-type processing-associated H-X9-DG protein/prepilin-type N-terminal cleavage/methylation domain-containing protein
MHAWKRSSPSAFTLVELLVVIGIVGVLGALLLPVLSTVAKRAKRVPCANNLRHLGQALQEFVAENHVYPLDANVGFTNGAYPNLYEDWMAALNHQLGNSQEIDKGIWRCPEMKRPSAWPTNEGYSFSYGYNNYGILGKGTFPNASVRWESHGLGRHFGNSHLPSTPISESEVVSSSEMMAIGDGFMGNESFVEGESMLIRVYAQPAVLWDTKEPFARHQGKANIAFCDGHVESPTLKYLFQDTSDDALRKWNRDHQPHRELLSP